MVRTPNAAEVPQDKPTVQEQRRLTTIVSLKEVLDAKFRFEASAYNIEARQALSELRQSGLELRRLFGAEDALSNEAHNAFRFVRHFVESDRGVPFISSAEINSLRPRADNYISRKLTKNLDRLLIKQWDVLISCSGTIGNVGFAGKTFADLALSQDAIRVRFGEPNTAGFVAAFLRSEHGRLLLRMGSYGSVITHIEPQHLAQVLIPWPHPIQVSDIGRLFVEAAECRDEANTLLDQADELLRSHLKLPSLDQLKRQIPKSSKTIIKASTLVGRLEASFHDPLVDAIQHALRDSGYEITTLGDSNLVNEIRPITKFRKRIYVEEGGIPLLSSKQLFQIDPIDVKKLAKGAHTKDLKEIALEPNMLAVTCSGTIGRVQIIPSYMQGWTANQHATRILASSDEDAGFLYTWLASEAGNKLIQRYSYGSVILEIDKDMLAAVAVPVLPESQRSEIGKLVLQANALRDEAWKKEQDAITRIDRLITHPPSQI
jgi:type I restriction enzyme S subunit